MELEMEARAPRAAAYQGLPSGRAAAALAWIAGFAIPGMGMFSEAYFIFSVRILRADLTTLTPKP